MKFTMKLAVAIIALIGYIGFTSFVSNSARKTLSEGYTVTLQSNSQDPEGNYEWVWAVTNPNPGNGTNGTLQDLSHWALILPSCVGQSNIRATAYSTDGISWQPLNASIGVDPSQNCYTGPVLKFDVGTSGSSTTYYKLTVDSYYNSGFVTGVFKSGKRTGCYTSADLIIGPSCDGGPR